MAGVALDYGINKGLPLSTGIEEEETPDDQERTGGVDLSYGIGKQTGTDRTGTGLDLTHGIESKGSESFRGYRKTELSLEKLEVYPGLPGKTFTHKKEKYEFDEDIYRNYSLMYGKRAKEYLDGELAKCESWEEFRSNKSIRPKE